MEIEHQKILSYLHATLREHVHTRDLALTDAHMATASLPVLLSARVKATWRISSDFGFATTSPVFPFAASERCTQ